MSGEINAAAESGLNQAYSQAVQEGPETVMLDFSNVGYINSTGIALIVGLLAQARKTHTQMVVYGLSPHYEEIFRITRLSDFMRIYPDANSALEEVVQ
jgi:anti-anti-sigma factor